MSLVKLLDEPLKSPRPGRPAGITPGYRSVETTVERNLLGGNARGILGSQPAGRIKPWTEAKIKQICSGRSRRR